LTIDNAVDQDKKAQSALTIALKDTYNRFAQLWCRDNYKVKQQQQWKYRPRYRIIAKTLQVTRQINMFNGTDKSSKISKIDTVW